MRLPRVRFTVRRLIAAVAIVAVVLALEPILFDYAAEVVRSGDRDYIWGEAVTVWIILNVAISMTIGVMTAFFGAALRDRSEAR